LALQDYDMAHEHYPAGTTNPTGPIQNLPNGEHISWIAKILPYIEEPALYNKLDLTVSAYHHTNDPARQTAIELLICPSCPADYWPYSNYAGCHHDVEAPIDVNNRGVLFLNSRITREDLKDGAGHTLFLGEKLPDDTDLGWLSGTPGTLRNTGSPLNQGKRGIGWGSASVPWVYSYAANDTRWQWPSGPVDENGDPLPADGGIVEGATAPGETSDTSTKAPTETPDAASTATPSSGTPSTEPASADAPATAQTAAAEKDPERQPDKNGLLPHSRLGGNTSAPLYVGGFSSSHNGGVNFAFGDGSVRFVSDIVSAGVMGRLANRDDGQLIDAKEMP
jgi:prepilin-type processing-associated H-X9-DG protein